MASIKPFKGIRPAIEFASKVPSLSVDTYLKSELKKELTQNPYSFLQIIKTNAKGEEVDSEPYLKKVKNKFDSFVKKGIFIQDKKESLYIYQQNTKGKTYKGIISLVSVDDYFNGTIKTHEKTFPDRVKKLTQYLDVCEINAEPVLFSYPDNTKLEELVEISTKETPLYDFISEDLVEHKLWKVEKPNLVSEITKGFSELPNIYVSDGHHRSKSSVDLAVMRNKNKDSDNAPYHYFLSILFPESQLTIHNYNRLVKKDKQVSDEDFLKQLSKKFEITPLKSNIHTPSQKHTFSLYMSNKWYHLKAKEALSKAYANKVDSALLTEEVFEPILKINSQIIKYVPGTVSTTTLMKEVDSLKYDLAFVLKPMTIEEIKLVADNNLTIPQKTTWIEPKLRSAMVIYSFADKYN